MSTSRARESKTDPWINIPLGDYEGHMSLPSIGQARMLADEFELQTSQR
jgi:hypothetical protein